MDLLEAIKVRHTIRTYDGQPIAGQDLETLNKMIAAANAEGNLHLQLVNGQPDALAPFTVHYGRWTNVTNYIACVGQDDASLEQRCGYYGEKIALWAETAGLKTGWVDTRTGSQLPDAFHVADGERFVLCLCIGTSEKVGRPHKVKSVEQLSDVTGQTPEWFARGMEAAQLAPTAGNQQAFTIHFDGTNLSITTADGNLACVDMGIAQYHFELGSGIDHARWAQA